MLTAYAALRAPSIVLPLTAVVLAAAALGYGWHTDSRWWLWAAVGLLLALCGLVIGIDRRIQRSFAPWQSLAQTVQQRTPRDLSPVFLAPDAPYEVHAMVHTLNQMLAQVHTESDAQQRFVADSAHQLRTPLAALQSQVEAWAQMVQAAPDKTIQLHAEQVEQLRKATRRTTQLAHQLLALSRIDSGLHQSSLQQRVDLKSLCEALLESFWERALAKEIDLGLEVESAHVSGHAWLLRELLSNLLDNAIKYVPQGGQITLRCGRRKLWPSGQMRTYLEVEDDGLGVPECEYVRLTQRFYRVPSTEVEGTGLGLSIAQEIVQGHGATLAFSRGKNGQGLLVTVVFAT